MKQILIEKYIAPNKVERQTIGEEEYIIERWYDSYEELHSLLGQPAIIYYNKNKQVSAQYWCKNGEGYRDKDNPSSILYYDNGQIKEQCWYKKLKLHRESNNPAIIKYSENGEVKEKFWYKNGTKQPEKNKKLTPIEQSNGSENKNTIISFLSSKINFLNYLCKIERDEQEHKRKI